MEENRETVIYSNQPEGRLMLMLLGGYDAESNLVSAYSKCNDYKLVGKLAVQAKTIFKAREGAVIVATMLGSDFRHEEWVFDTLDQIVETGEDLLTLFDTFQFMKPHSGLPSLFRKVIKQKVRTMSYQQLQGCPASEKGTTLYDLINLSHPKPTEPLNKFMQRGLPPRPYWKKVKEDYGIGKAVSSGVMPYRELLKHLPLIMQQNPIIKDFAYSQIKNPTKIMEEKILPLDLKLYYDMVKDVRCQQALTSASESALENMPDLEGRTLVLVDRSSSMRWGSPPYIQSAATIAASLKQKNPEHTDIALYNESVDFYNSGLKGSVLTIADDLEKVELRRTANLNRIIYQLHEPFDRIFILTNKAVWNGAMSPQQALKAYYERQGVNPYVYGINLKGRRPTEVIDHRLVVMPEFSKSSVYIPRLVEE